MTPPSLLKAAAAPLTPEQRRGRALLLTLFTISVLLDVALVVFKAIQEGLDGIAPSCIRVCLTIALMYAIWIGQRWARWLYVTLTYIAAALMLLVVILKPNPLFFAMLVVFAGTGTLVGFSKGIGSFLQFQREKR